MKAGTWLSAALVLGMLAFACTTTPTATGEDRICTPGAYVFCRCADRTKGTKLCQPDGASFGQCAVDESGECVGGEIADPNTGKDVDGNGDIKPGQGDDDDVAGGPTELDTCPGKAVSIPPGREVLLEGDTSRAINDRRGQPGGACAASIDAKDYIYQLTPSGSGKLTAIVTGKGALDPIVYFRTICDDENSQKGCGAQTGTKVTQASTTVRTGIPVWLVVDGASGGAGEFTASLKLVTGPFCGDGEITTGEACDDTNNADGDGCNASCRGVDGDPASGGSCPGQPVAVWPGTPVSGKGSTTNYPNTLGTPSASCGLDDANTFLDHVYQVTPKGTGTMTVKLEKQDDVKPLPNLMLSAHATCTATAVATKCANVGGVGVGETLTVPVTNGTPVFIAVDGGGLVDNKGDYKITFSLPR